MPHEFRPLSCRAGAYHPGAVRMPVPASAHQRERHPSGLSPLHGPPGQRGRPPSQSPPRYFFIRRPRFRVAVEDRRCWFRRAVGVGFKFPHHFGRRFRCPKLVIPSGELIPRHVALVSRKPVVLSSGLRMRRLHRGRRRAVDLGGTVTFRCACRCISFACLTLGKLAGSRSAMRSRICAAVALTRVRIL